MAYEGMTLGFRTPTRLDGEVMLENWPYTTNQLYEMCSETCVP